MTKEGFIVCIDRRIFRVYSLLCNTVINKPYKMNSVGNYDT